MDKLFKAIKNGDMVLACKSFQLKGKAKSVFTILNLLATTEPIESDVYWWSVRADIIARDRDMQLSKLSINARLNMRCN